MIFGIFKRYMRLIRKTKESKTKTIAQVGMFLIITQICSTFVGMAGFCATFFWTNLSLAMLILVNLERKEGLVRMSGQGELTGLARRIA